MENLLKYKTDFNIYYYGSSSFSFPNFSNEICKISQAVSCITSRIVVATS